MKLTIQTRCEPIEIFGQFNPVDLSIPDRKVFIDDKEVPPALSRIILLGIDVASEQYLDLVEKQMLQEGHKL